MFSVNIHEAKTHLSRLVDQAAGGEEIVIAKAGRPVARLVALTASAAIPRRLGRLAGKHVVPDDIDSPFERAIAEMFEGAKADR